MRTQVRLVADDLILRPWTARDIDDLVRALDDPEIERFTSAIPLPYTREHARAFIEEIAPTTWAHGGAEFAIERGGEAVGCIAVRQTERAGAPLGVTGYWVAAPARRQGVATRALRAVTDWALGTLRVGGLELVHDIHNAASCVVATRAGFVADGVVLDEAVFRDGRARWSDTASPSMRQRRAPMASRWQ